VPDLIHIHAAKNGQNLLQHRVLLSCAKVCLHWVGPPREKSGCIFLQECFLQERCAKNATGALPLWSYFMENP